MYMTPVPYGGAGARYRTIDMSSRLEGASPHRLVAILFEELLRAIETVQAAERRGDRGKRAERQARAVSILHALESSLDFERGGEVATSLSSIYREAQRLLTANQAERARAMLAEIAEAWDSIG